MLFGSDFGGGSSFTPWMKEHMVDYIDAHYISLEKHYGTWDPHLCHWIRFDWSLEVCMHDLKNGGLLTCRYKHFHDFLRRHLLDVHFYYVVM